MKKILRDGVVPSSLILFNEIKDISEAITVRGAELGWAITNNLKIVENRSQSLGLEIDKCYALHVGKGDIIEGNMRKLLEDIKGLETLSDLERGVIVGVFRVCDRRENDNCGTSVWVDQKVCYVLDATIEIFEPIKCIGHLGKWKLDRVDPMIRPKLIKRLFTSSTGMRFNDLNKKNLI